MVLKSKAPHIIVINIKVEWLWNPLDSFVIWFCYLFWTWPCTTFNSIPIILNLLTNRNIALIYSVIFWEKKTKDCARSGSFQHKLQHRCFQLWCLPAVITTVSSTNYAQTKSHVEFWIITFWSDYKSNLFGAHLWQSKKIIYPSFRWNGPAI